MPQRAASEQQTLKLRLSCLRPPVVEDAEFGVQDRDQALHEGQAESDGAVRFEIPITASRRAEGEAVRLGGPFVHGTAAAPFLYLGLRRITDEPGVWVRRLKVPLPVLAWEQAVSFAGRGVLIGRVSGEGSGTVRLEGGGWEWR
jgi:hypothetical protein